MLAFISLDFLSLWLCPQAPGLAETTFCCDDSFNHTFLTLLPEIFLKYDFKNSNFYTCLREPKWPAIVLGSKNDTTLDLQTMMSLSTGNETMSSLLCSGNEAQTQICAPRCQQLHHSCLKHRFAGVCVQESCQNAYQVGMLPDTTKENSLLLGELISTDFGRQITSQDSIFFPQVLIISPENVSEKVYNSQLSDHTHYSGLYCVSHSSVHKMKS